MQRHREIAAAPERRASETWDAIATLVADTLDRSPAINRSTVKAALDVAEPAGTILIAGGHLESHPLVLIADPIHLTIRTVSGLKAMDLDEDLGPVPGGISATGWMLYLPTPSPVADEVRAIASTSPHLSSDEPMVKAVREAEPNGTAEVLDVAALRKREQERR
jgi:hypothetical protein